MDPHCHIGWTPVFLLFTNITTYLSVTMATRLFSRIVSSLCSLILLVTSGNWVRSTLLTRPSLRSASADNLSRWLVATNALQAHSLLESSSSTLLDSDGSATEIIYAYLCKCYVNLCNYTEFLQGVEVT